MNSKQKGDIAVAQAIAYYVKNGYEVLSPLGDRMPYDLVIDDGVFQKVQCKYTAFINKYGRFAVDLRITGGNQSFHTIKKYSKNDFDLLFVCTERFDLYEIPMTVISSANITFGDKYKKYKVS